jgi:signal transduction histidine kinase
MQRQRRWILPVSVIGVFTLLGLSKFLHFWLDDLARGHRDRSAIRLIEEMTGAYVGALMFLLLVWVVARWPLTRESWRLRLVPYACLVTAMSVLDTTLMWASRAVISPLAGLGPYDYGMMQFRYPMEFAIQAPNLALVILLLHAWRWYRASRERELQATRLQAELTRVRLERLEAQLQPHFLFNALNGISALMYHEPARADRLLGRLADLLRLSFSRPGEPLVALADELKWLGWYLEIMQLRYGDRLTVCLEVAANTLDLAVPRLILQPLVENAIKHGAARRAGPATVTIAAARAGDRLRLTVLDDGPGLGDHAAGGVGLTNTRERLRALFDDTAGLVLVNRAGGGLEARIDLPARSGLRPTVSGVGGGPPEDAGTQVSGERSRTVPSRARSL